MLLHINVCVHVCACYMGQECLTPNWWTTRTIFFEVTSGHRATPPLRHTHTFSLIYPCLYTTTGRADGSPSARRARKSMWIKGYTQQVWRAASATAAWQRGGLRPPASRARGHLAGVLWNDEHAAATSRRYCHHDRQHAERRGSHLFSFSAWKWTDEPSVRRAACVCIRVWGRDRQWGTGEACLVCLIWRVEQSGGGLMMTIMAKFKCTLNF